MAKGIAQYTITAVYDGEDAQETGTLKAILTNEYYNIPAEYDGTPVSYTGAETSITVYDDIRNITSNCTITKTDSTGITSIIEDTNKIKITSVTNGTGGTVTITATLDDDRTVSRTFTVLLSKESYAGANNAPLVNITPSSLIFTSNGYIDGTYSPASITLTPNFTNSSYSKWQYSHDGNEWTDVVSGEDGLTINNSTKVLTIANTSSLYTYEETNVMFKCLTDSVVYDIVTLSRIYKSLPSTIIRSADEPDDPAEGMLWFNTSNGVFYCYHANAWVTQDMSEYATETQVNQVYNASNQVFVTQPLPTYKPGDMWIVQDEAPRPILSSNTTGLGVTPTSTTLAGDITITVDSSTVTIPAGNYSIVETRTVESDTYGLVQVGTTYYWVELSNGAMVPNSTGLNLVQRSDITVNGNTPITVSGSTVTIPVGVYQTLDQKEVSGTDYSLINANGTYYWVQTHNVDYSAYNGKILTCVVQEDAATGTFNISDWIVPLDAYTTVTQMQNVIGTDPTEWSTESKSITTLINENTNAIAGQQAQSAKLAVRASDIEMSFSKTGTMNFLGNSSGQNGLEGWTLSTASLFSVESTQALVSGYTFKESGSFGSGASFYNTPSNGVYATPPSSQTFTVSLKIKNANKFSYIFFEAVPMDGNGNRLDGGSSNNTGWVRYVPYAEESSGEYILEHFVCDKSIVSGMVSLRISVFFRRPTLDTSITTRPEWNDSYINKLIKEGNTYYYGEPHYVKMDIIKSNTVPDDMDNTKVWYCTDNIYNGNVIQYAAAVYYFKNSSGVLEAITDNYDITMLDKDNYYKRIGTGWVDVTSYVDTTNDVLTPLGGPIYFGDIMLNGGQMVQTWTPRQDENLWGENIKFNANGITIKNIPAGYSRTLDSSSDIAYQIDSAGAPIACIWKLTQSGFITKDIKCWGTFSMGNATNAIDVEGTFVPVMQMKRSSGNDGVDEYIFS